MGTTGGEFGFGALVFMIFFPMSIVSVTGWGVGGRSPVCIPICQHNRKQCHVDKLDVTLYSKLSHRLQITCNGNNSIFSVQGRRMQIPQFAHDVQAPMRQMWGNGARYSRMWPLGKASGHGNDTNSRESHMPNSTGM